jgi:hypothetical protein
MTTQQHLRRLLIAASVAASVAASGQSSTSNGELVAALAALGQSLQRRCDLETIACDDVRSKVDDTSSAAAILARRMATPSAEALLLRNCTDASVFPLKPLTWGALHALARGGTRLLLTSQQTTQAQLGPPLVSRADVGGDDASA